MFFGSLNLWSRSQLSAGGLSTILRSLFYQDNELPEGFVFTGSESYNDGGLEFDGAEKLEAALTGDEPWFNNGENGYMIVRYTTPSWPSVDQYLIDFHEGSGSVYPSIALRSYRDDGRPRGAVYDASGQPTMTDTTGLSLPVNTYHFAALTWNGTSANIITDNGQNDDAVNTLGHAFDVLTIGDDHNGGNKLTGAIAMIEIGTGVPSLPEIFSKAALSGDRVVNILGQSQGNHLFDSPADSSRIGHQTMIEEAGKYLAEPFCVFFINASDTGSAILSSSDAADAWVDNSASPTMADDQRLTDAIADATARGQTPEAGIWWQYQGDVFDIAAATSTIEDFELGLEHIKDRMVEEYGSSYKLILIPNGGRNEAVTDEVDEAHQTIRELYLSKAAEGGNYRRGPEVYDLGTYDATGHLTNAEIAIAAERIGRSFAYHLGLIDSNGVWYGDNIISRSDASAGTGWSQEGFIVTGTGATGFISFNNANVEEDETYEITFPIDEVTAGSVRFLLYDNNKVAVGTTYSAAGEHVQEVTVSAGTGTSGTYATIQVQSAFTGVIDLRKIKIRKKQTTSIAGPEATGFTNNAKQTLIDITHEQGTDFNSQPAGGYEGFAVFDEDGTRLTIDTVTRESATQLKLLTTTAPTGATIDIKYPYGALEGVTLANTVKDNSAEAMPLLSFIEEGITVGAALYAIQGLQFNGTNQYASKASDLTGLADGKVALGAFWLNVTDPAQGPDIIIENNGGYVRWSFNNQLLTLRFSQSSGGTVCQIEIPITTSGWHHIAFSFDLSNASNRHAAVDGSLLSDSVFTTYVNADIDWTRGSWAIGRYVSISSGYYDGGLAQLYLDDTYLNLSTNLSALYDGGLVDFGAAGANVTGSSPILLLNIEESEAAADFATNKGTGGDFTLNNSPSVSPTNPG